MRRVAFLMTVLLGLLPGVGGAQNFWEQASGPVYGSVQCFAFDSSGATFVGTDQAGVFRSNDMGSTWMHTSVGLAGHLIYWSDEVLSVVRDIATGPDGTMYASAGGLYSSTNKGDTWTQIDSNGTLSLAITPKNELFGIDADSIYRWNRVTNRWNTIRTNGGSSLRVGPSGRLFALSSDAGNSVILSTTDNGLHWREDTTGQFFYYEVHRQVVRYSKVFITKIVIHPNGDLIATAESGAAILDTTTGTWSQSFFSNPLLGAPAIIAADSKGVIFASRPAQSYPTISPGLFRSTDTGRTWDTLSRDFVERAIVAPNGTVFAVLASGVGRSDNQGSTWTNAQRGVTDLDLVTNLDLGRMFVTPKGDVILKTSSSIFRSTDRGMTWGKTDSEGKAVEVRAIAVTPAGTILGGRDGGQPILLSTDEGDTWAVGDSAVMDIVTFSAVSHAPIFAGSFYHGLIFRSTDDGRSWVKTDSVPGSVVAFGNAANGDLLVGTSYRKLFRSSNYGDSWEVMKDSVYAYSLLLTRHGRILCAHTSGMLLSINDGKSWSEVYPGHACVHLTMNAAGQVFAGTDSGIIASVDEGATWQSVNSGIPCFTAPSDIVSDSGGQLLAGISGNGIYRSTGAQLSVSTPSTQQEPFALPSNSPNPFTQTTTIRFTLPGAAAFASIKVYDITGCEIAVAASKEFPAGENEVTFDGNALPAGVYYYRVVSGSGMSAGRAFVKVSE